MAQTNNGETAGVIGRMLITGLVGGIFWGIIWLLLYYFNLTELAPEHFLLNPFTQAEWVDVWVGDFISIILTALISIGASIVYYILFRRINSMWMGVFYGLGLWVILFFLFQSLYANISPFFELDIRTLVSTIGLFILYGTFIGYTISYDHLDLVIRGAENVE